MATVLAASGGRALSASNQGVSTALGGVSVGEGMGRAEFILLIAALMSILALSVDIMLPALPRIEEALPGATSDQGAALGEYVIFALVLGMSITPLAFGLCADAFGRRAPLLAALALFAFGGVVCAAAMDFQTLLAGRFIQGMGVVGPRIIAMAVVRDRFEGRRMASVMSVVMMVFIAVPAIAPTLGLGLEMLAGWRSLFVALSVFAALLMAWIVLRLPETLTPEKRRPIERKAVVDGLVAVFTRRPAMGAMIASGVLFSSFLAYIGTAQDVFGDIYGFGDNFVFLFSILAFFIGGASFVNSRIVERVGVRAVLYMSLRGLLGVSAVAGFVFSLGSEAPPFQLYIVWCAAMAFLFGLTFGNINALAMHYLGDLAGLGAAVLTTLQNLLAAVGAAVISSQIHDGPTPLTLGFAICGAISYLILLSSERARKPGEEAV